MNNLFNQMNGNNNMISAFMQFKNNLTGDPKQQVMQLLQSGKMSNQQFQSLQEQAKQFGKMLGMK
jgi:hypothetical protein